MTLAHGVCLAKPSPCRLASAFPSCRAFVVAVVVAALVTACQRAPSFAASPSPSVDSAARHDEAPRWPEQGARLPEDPVAGKRAEEQWRAHLAREDRERQLARDRHALTQHKAIIALLVRTHRTIERARSDKAMRAATARLSDVGTEVERRLEKINVWGNVSPVTSIYRDMVLLLKQGLSIDRRVSAGGGSDGHATSSFDWNGRLAEIRAYLHEAAESEGEGE